MKNMKKLIGVMLCMALLASVSACGKKSEETSLPEDTTEVTTTAEDTTDEETTEEETTEAVTTEDVTTEEITTEADVTTEAATTGADGTTTAADETTAAAAETTAAPAENTTAAPTEAATEAPTEAPAPQSNADPISFTFNGGTLVLGESAQGFTAAVPANNSESSPSCLGNGEDINYYYNDFTIYVWNDNGSYKTIGIDITGAGAETSRGIKIGSTEEDVIAAYGNDYLKRESEFVYDFDNNCHLGFTLNDGKVTFISYNQDN